jgi:hypothetical protein
MFGNSPQRLSPQKCEDVIGQYTKVFDLWRKHPNTPEGNASRAEALRLYPQYTQAVRQQVEEEEKAQAEQSRDTDRLLGGDRSSRPVTPTTPTTPRV